MCVHFHMYHVHLKKNILVVIQFSKIRRQAKVKKKKTTLPAKRFKADEKEKEEEISDDYVWDRIPNSKKNCILGVIF